MKMLDIGFGNYLMPTRIVCIASPDSAPIKRLIGEAKESGRAIDATCGKRTLSVIITDSDHIVLSSLSAEDIGESL